MDRSGFGIQCCKMFLEIKELIKYKTGINSKIVPEKKWGRESDFGGKQYIVSQMGCQSLQII